MQIVLDTAGHFTYSTVSPAQCMNISDFSHVVTAVISDYDIVDCIRMT